MHRLFPQSSRLAGLFSCALALVGCAPTPHTSGASATQGSAKGRSLAHAWNVYDGETLILEVHDTPGPLVSTAMLPPGVAPNQHPFLSASARSSIHEHKLRELLEESRDLPDFLRRLEGAGYAVRPLPAN